jgi:hypothetical protein
MALFLFKTFACDNRDWLRSIAAFRRLGEMARTIRELEKKVAELCGKQTGKTRE